jgi:hypothetical protein
MLHFADADPSLASRAFRDQMTLRRGMLDVSSISQRATRHSHEAQALLLRGIIACRSCSNTSLCAKWLSIARKPASPPDFCPMRDAVLELRQVLATGTPA